MKSVLYGQNLRSSTCTYVLLELGGGHTPRTRWFGTLLTVFQKAVDTSDFVYFGSL
jgi:hypothetical protein